jgi:hypothetical protein
LLFDESLRYRVGLRAGQRVSLFLVALSIGLIFLRQRVFKVQ